ncbi:sugar-transfer associated ATP-grasp domain-containing protein [Dongia sp.]|uniref:sugar-transfer associated ATP-grasp domain-containing protein n=1 Tax=Dongia sp. TaxID=1977262 RepID=UPI0035B25DA5
MNTNILDGAKIGIQKFPPPLPLLWAFLPAGQGYAARLHKLHFRAIWRSMGWLQKLEMAGLLILWPFLLAPRIADLTRRNGAMVKARTGKGIARQIAEQVILAARFGFRPQAYYVMEFFLPERRAEAGDYIHRYVVKDGLYRRIKRGLVVSPLTDKEGFASYCTERGLPVSHMELSLGKGAILSGGGKLPADDLFVKRTLGRGGARAELWQHSDGAYRSRDGERLEHDALLARLIRLSEREPFVVQRCLKNHPDIAPLSPGALATVRLVTLIDETGDFEPVRAVFRMGKNADSIVDNFHSGGIAAPVDLATGKLGRATDFGLAPSIGWIDRHPATGAAITGHILPQWPEILALGRKAHAQFADRVIVGWDIALTDRGLVLVEGNAAPDVDNIQRPHANPLGPSRYGALMCWHLRA